MMLSSYLVFIWSCSLRHSLCQKGKGMISLCMLCMLQERCQVLFN